MSVIIVLVLFGHADERGFTQKYANARVIALVLAPKFTRNIAFTERVRTRSFGRYFLSVLYVAVAVYKALCSDRRAYFKTPSRCFFLLVVAALVG